MRKWILGGAAALVVGGLIFAGSAMAAGGRGGMMSTVGFGTGMLGAGHAGMVGAGHAAMMGGDMAEMHNAMAPLMSQMPAMHTEQMGEVAKLLGMTTDELTAAVSEGKTLAQLAQEKKVAVGEVRAAMTKSMKAFLDQAVAAKSLTPEQAGKMLGFMEENVGDCLTGQGMMGGMMKQSY